MTDITADRANELLSYEPMTGALLWKQDRRSGFAGKINVRAGDEAGFVGAKGYRIVRIDGKNYRAHRVVWLMVHGEWPSDEIDHINGNRTDNRIANLRNVTRAQNAKNRGVSKRNRWGVKGVTWDNLKKSFRADIAADGRANYLGNYPTIDEAAAAYEAASLELHGEFRRAA